MKWYARATEKELQQEAEYLASRGYDATTRGSPLVVMEELFRLADETSRTQDFLPRESLDDRPLQPASLRDLLSQGVISIDKNPWLLFDRFIYNYVIQRAASAKEIDEIHRRRLNRS